MTKKEEPAGESKSGRMVRGNTVQLSATISTLADKGIDDILKRMGERMGTPYVKGKRERSRFLRILFEWHEEALILGVDPLEFVDKMEKARKKGSK